MLPVVVGVSGASGMIYAVRLVKYLLAQDYQVELVASKAAILVWQAEHLTSCPINPKQQAEFWRQQTQETKGKLTCHPWADVSATIASGSFRSVGMVIIPCSMSTVAKVSQGLSSDLLERAADVILKEGRRLVVVPRETPFSLIHLRNLTALCEAGAKIVPAIPAWYHQPQTIEDLVDFVVERALEQLGVESQLISPWQGRI
ncbi:MAG: flavin prenyltransferase UbiX [Pseudanabaenaceae cyanobacterium bins.68]|nr:flavin prenyltransferase UbiX [Pseudanabaenaceae cyanobacterium bins.68]